MKREDLGLRSLLPVLALAVVLLLAASGLPAGGVRAAAPSHPEPAPSQGARDPDSAGDVEDDEEIVVRPNGPMTLQEALDLAAVTGQRVRALPGTYRGRFQLHRGVHLVGSGSDRTILDGEGLGRTVTMGTMTTLEGFAITGGVSEGIGGGVGTDGEGYNWGNHGALVRNNLIHGNTAAACGGAGGVLRLQDNAVEQNTSDGSGGGACLFGADYLSIDLEATRNVFRDNHSDSRGGGLFVNNLGGSMDFGATITDNLLVGNTAETGGGLELYWNYSFYEFFTVTNNTIVGNTATAPNGVGGAWLSYEPQIFSDFENNIIVGNEGGGVGWFKPDNCDVWGNTPEDYVDTPNYTGQRGNISADPLFRDQAGGDFRLTPGSPAIDSGLTRLGTDLEGYSRFRDGDLDGTAETDMGALEERQEVEGLLVAEDGTVSWDAHADASAYNLYRGDLVELRAQGLYTQDLGTVPLAERWCDLGSTGQIDIETLPGDSLCFYLVTPEAVVEGSLGYQSNTSERGNTHRCP